MRPRRGYNMKNIGKYAVIANYKNKIIIFSMATTKADAEKRVRIIKKNPKTKSMGYTYIRYKKL